MQTGDFGKMAKQYTAGRKGLPDEVLSYLWSFCNDKNQNILDVGCGTGIITRQLAEQGATVTGIDADHEMIEEALRISPQSIPYHTSPAHALPFSSETFDGVTIASALHWFANQESIEEIKRVLKQNGSIFILNKNDSGIFGQEFRNIIKGFISENSSSKKEHYNPQLLLADSGFKTMTKKVFQVSELYSVAQALEYMQSISFWNLVSEKFRPEALHQLKEYCENNLQNNLIERQIEIVVWSGVK